VYVTDILVKKGKRATEKLQEYKTPLFLIYVQSM